MKINKRISILISSIAISLGAVTGVATWVFTGSSSSTSKGNVNVIDRTFDSITANVSALSLSANRNCSHVSASSGNGYTGVNIADYYTVIKDGVDLDNSGITSAISSGSLVVSTTGDCKYSSGKIYMSNLSSSASTGSKDASITLSFANAGTSSSSVNEGNHSDLLTFNRPKSKTCVGPGCNKLVNEQYTVSSTNHNHDDECLDCSESSSCGTECSTVSCNDCPEEDCLNNNCTSANKKHNSSLAYNGFLETNSSTSESSVTITGSTTTTEGSWSKKSGSESYNYYCTGTMTQYSSTSTCSGTITRRDDGYYTYYCDDCGETSTASKYNTTCGANIITTCAGTVKLEETGHYTYHCDTCSTSDFTSADVGNTCNAVMYKHCGGTTKKINSYATCNGTKVFDHYTYCGGSKTKKTGQSSYTCGSTSFYTKDTTCTGTGIKKTNTVTGTCGGTLFRTNEIEVTCRGTINASIVYKCVACGASYSSSRSSCTRCSNVVISSTSYTCSRCGASYSSKGTCTKVTSTTQTYACTSCGASYSSKPSSCTAKTSKTNTYYVCSSCGISMSGIGTCGRILSTSYVCNSCGASYSSSRSSCTAKRTSSYTYYVCDTCGETSYTSGSCTEITGSIYKCNNSSCGKTYSSGGICTASIYVGYYYKCDTCGYITDEAPNAYNYCTANVKVNCSGTVVSEWVVDSQYYACDTCGAGYSNTYADKPCTHTETATCTGTITRKWNTSYTYYCDDCGETSTASKYNTTCGANIKTYYTECNKCTNRSGSIGDTCGALRTGSKTYYYCSVCSCRL